MAVYKDKNGTWYVSARYDNWQGEHARKVKRGFKTKKDAMEWERDFLLEKAGSLDMTFEAFVELYKTNLKERLKQSTWQTKISIIDNKILPYFRKKRMTDIKVSDVVAWQNKLLNMADENGTRYSLVYLKTVHNQLSAIFNHAVRFYDLPTNPAAKAGNMGKEKTREMLYWTKDEYIKFSEEIMDKPVSFYAFEMLYWCGLRLGEMLALTPADFNFEKGIVRINKSYQRMYSDDPKPYGSYGNGAAMRVSACGFAATSMAEAIELSRKVTEVTHNHPEGIKGAEATAVAIYMARTGSSILEIRDYINNNYYPMNFTLDGIRDSYSFNETCQETVPQAIMAFLESENFEDAIRNAIDKQAEDMFSRLVKEMAVAEGVTEQLKADDQMLWVAKMNNIRNRAIEIVNTEIIYA